MRISPLGGGWRRWLAVSAWAPRLCLSALGWLPLFTNGPPRRVRASCLWGLPWLGLPYFCLVSQATVE